MNRTFLNLDRLESREVPSAARPSVIDLTHVGASGSNNGALFTQYNARANPQNGPVDSFLRLDDGGREKGYNTDSRLQFDETRRGTHSIQVDDLPLVTIGGVQYRQLVLDVNEPSRRNSKISLDELQIFVSGRKSDLNGYNDNRNTLGGLKPVWQMDANRWVSIDASLNNQTGTGDMIVSIPACYFGSNPNAFVALFSKFGGHQKANGAFEQWGPGFVTSTPQVFSATISGTVFLDGSPAGNHGITVELNGVHYADITTDENGRYTIDVELEEGSSNTIRVTGGDGSTSGAAQQDGVEPGSSFVLDLPLTFNNNE
jgi:hypothetical protein